MGKIFYDVTMEIHSGMMVYPGDPEVTITNFKSIAGGDRCNVSMLCFGSHTGTHIDAPKHFFDDGMNVDELDLDYFFGRVRVLSIPEKDTVTVEDLAGFGIQPGERILIKTRNSDLPKTEFRTHFTYVTPEAAAYLAEIGIKTLGFDYLSVEKYGSPVPEAHYVLLGKNVVLIEGLDLAGVKPGVYEMVALPLKIVNGNGSPVRVVLIEEKPE